MAKPDTLLAWYRQLVAHKFDGSGCRGYPGRPRILPEVERLVVQMARQNRGWGYDRIVGALANLGHAISDRTVGNILRRHNIAPAPERSRTTNWKEFIRSHMEALAGAERNHQGKDNLLLFPVAASEASSRGAIRCRERLGGLLKYYSRAA